MRRDPAVVFLTVALVLVVAAGVGVSVSFALAAQREAVAARQAEQQAQAEKERADAAAEAARQAKEHAQEQAQRAEQLLYANQIRLAHDAFAEGEAARAGDLFKPEMGSWRSAPRDWEYRHLRRLFEAWRPDGGRIDDPDPARP